MSIIRLIIFYFLFTVVSFAANKINLTNQEITYIKNNPVVKIGGGESFEPFVFKNSKGFINGIDRDIANIIEARTGLKIKFEVGLWSDIQKRALNGEFDGISSAAKTKKREEFYNFPASYLDYTAVVIINRSNHNKISNVDDVQNKKVAIQKDNAGFERLAKTLGNVEIVYYDTIYKVLDAVVKNEVDFTILDESIFYLAEKFGISNFIETSFLLGKKNDIYFPLTKEKPLLSSIFNKAIGSINEYERREIKNKWFKTFTTKNLSLTKEEKEYLYSKNKINICIDSNWYPFEKLENGKHIGISADFLELFKSELKIPFKLIGTKNWTESLTFIEYKHCDILPIAIKTEKRDKYLNFTKPYLSLPLVVVTRGDIPFIDNLNILKDKKIGMLKDYAYHELIKEKYPNLNIIEVGNKKDGLEKVVTGELFGFIDALASISYEFQENFSKDLKISGKFDENIGLSVAIRNDDLILLNIFEKLVSNLDSEKKQNILNKYISIKYEHAMDYSLTYKIVVGAIFIILMILYWTSKIKKAKEKINNLYNDLKEKEFKVEELNKKLMLLSSTDELTNIYNRRKINEYLINELERSKRTGNYFSVTMIDIDYFKKVNDTYGHLVGDEVLCAFSKLIKQEIRKTDIFGRWGGEEFLIISPYTPKEGAIEKMQRIRKKIEETSFNIAGKQTASFGITIYKDNDTLKDILGRVDIALYKAKETGRNRVIFS